MALALDKVVEQFEDALPVLVVLGVVARLMVLVLEVVVVISRRPPLHAREIYRADGMAVARG